MSSKKGGEEELEVRVHVPGDLDLATQAQNTDTHDGDGIPSISVKVT